MELLIVLLILGVLLWIFGVPLQTLLLGVVILIAILLSLMLLFFIVTALSLLLFRVQKGTFVRFDTHHRYEQAVYLVDGNEYVNLFPAETVMRQQIYHDRSRRLLVRKGKRRNVAYDMHSILIMVLGLLGTSFALWLFVTVLGLFF